MIRPPPISTLFPYTTLFRSSSSSWPTSFDSSLFQGFRQFLARIEHARKKLRSEEHTSELQSHVNLVCRLLLEKKKEIVRRKQTETFPHNLPRSSTSSTNKIS